MLVDPQCEAEVVRLEGIRAAGTRRRAAERLTDLRSACEATRLAVPRLPGDSDAIIAAQGPDVGGKVLSSAGQPSPRMFNVSRTGSHCRWDGSLSSHACEDRTLQATVVYQAVRFRDGSQVCAKQAAALLVAVEGLLAGVEAAAERRAEVLARIEELELRQEEAAWLAVYETDEGRYKVCAGRRKQTA